MVPRDYERSWSRAATSGVFVALVMGALYWITDGLGIAALTAAVSFAVFTVANYFADPLIKRWVVRTSIPREWRGPWRRRDR